MPSRVGAGSDTATSFTIMVGDWTTITNPAGHKAVGDFNNLRTVNMK
jgi:hypothetical protein